MSKPGKIRSAMPADEVPEKADLQWAVDTIARLKREPSGNIVARLKLWERAGWTLFKAFNAQREVIKAYQQWLTAEEEGVEFPNSGKAWSEEDDDYLVQERAGGASILRIAVDMGRTPASVATRLSQLVGIRREVLRVQGRQIEGQLDESEVSGVFTGVIRRAQAPGDMHEPRPYPASHLHFE